MNDTSNPSLSIGLPVYNGSEFLEETMDSILAQTFINYELVISDNASTDQTEEICCRYAAMDDRVRYIRQEENIGACANFNFVFTESKGRYFKWAAADDVLEPEYLARCVEVLNASPEYVLCHTKTATIGAAGDELPNDIIRSSGAAEDPDNQVQNFDRPWRRFRGVLLGNGNPVYDTAVLDFYGVIRSDELANTGLLRPYVGYEKILMAALALQGRIAELPMSLFAYRLHPHSVSSQNSTSAQREWSDPQSKSGSYPRIRYLTGYIRSVFGKGLTVRDQLYCFFVIVQYLFQVRKWKRVILASLLDRGIGDGNVEILKQHDIAKRSAGETNVSERAYFKNSPESGA